MTELPVMIWPLAIVIIVLLFCSGVISGSEVAFFSFTPSQLQECRTRLAPYDRHILHLLDRPKALLATILILNNFVNVGIVTVATYITWEITGSKDNEVATFILTVVVTGIIVFFGEIFPKIIASQRNLSVAKYTSGIFVTAVALLHPFSWLLMALGKFLESRLESLLRGTGFEVSASELSEAVEMTTTTQEVSEEQKDILKGIVNFGTKSVKQIMCARMDITALDIEIDFHELLDKVNKMGYSRLPVFADTIDRIEGILYVKDLLPHIHEKEGFAWQQLIRRDTFFVPEGKKLDDMLKAFQERRVHMAIVVDEYGGTSGLVTLEDIIEEVVGEINDEFDTEDLPYSKISHDTYSFEAKISLVDFCRVLDIDPGIFESVKGDSGSLAGLMLELFGTLPKQNARYEYKGMLFSMASVNNKRIKAVRVQIKNKPSSETAS
jgi:putative hemolysin